MDREKLMEELYVYLHGVTESIHLKTEGGSREERLQEFVAEMMDMVSKTIQAFGILYEIPLPDLLLAAEESELLSHEEVDSLRSRLRLMA